MNSVVEMNELIKHRLPVCSVSRSPPLRDFRVEKVVCANFHLKLPNRTESMCHAKFTAVAHSSPRPAGAGSHARTDSVECSCYGCVTQGEGTAEWVEIRVARRCTRHIAHRVANDKFFLIDHVHRRDGYLPQVRGALGARHAATRAVSQV